ncbi:hypothetical protein L9F63_014543 [Diploptera punctata]|uniref:Uncharacterized protein n=1 Tax=Diploptera punctata TaxID=6984 RepID=A0AAD8ELK1_DIPPU|nr:hypothetical protein L9F63_014543 [Diploptera punctata]
MDLVNNYDIPLFTVFKRLLDKGVHLNLNNEFKKLTKNSERVKYATDILKQYNLLPNEMVTKVKSLEKSVELRDSGNKVFVKKYEEALLLYTKSIAAAPFPTTENANDALAIAFANRSAVLFRLGKYNLCLQDISQALKYNYPNKLQYKLFERQGKCLHYLRRNKDATNSINVSIIKNQEFIGNYWVRHKTGKKSVILRTRILLSSTESQCACASCCNG